jgi:hypothetical protein
MKVPGELTHSEKIITRDEVEGDNFFPRVLIYPKTFIQGQYVYNNTSLPTHAIQPMIYRIPEIQEQTFYIQYSQ